MVNNIMKKTAVAALAVLLIASAIVAMPESVSAQDSPEDKIIVDGLGYPPIKAKNSAQAHLMAKRAALIDAYRNVLVTSGAAHYEDEVLYSGLSGFVKGITVLEEEYLEDGGVRVTVSAPSDGHLISSQAVDTVIDSGKGLKAGPKKVTLKRWYNIIEELVSFED